MPKKVKEDEEPKDFNTPCRKYGDMYCKLCDSHMNTKDMWMAHIQGKRHLKNLEKGKVDLKYEDTDVVSTLQKDLDELDDEPVVGLDFICELQKGEDKSLLKCFLCSANQSSKALMIEHIRSLKHKLAYMKKYSPEDFQQVQSTGLVKSHVQPIIEDICARLENEHGKGKVMIKKERQKQTATEISVPPKLYDEGRQGSGSICVKEIDYQVEVEEAPESMNGAEKLSHKRPYEFQGGNLFKKRIIEHLSLEKDLRQQSHESKDNFKWRPIGDPPNVKTISTQQVSASESINSVQKEKKNATSKSTENAMTTLKDIPYKEFIDIVFSVVESLTCATKEELVKLEAIARTLTDKLGIYHFSSLTEEQQNRFLNACQANSVDATNFLQDIQKSGLLNPHMMPQGANFGVHGTVSCTSNQLSHMYANSPCETDSSIPGLTLVDGAVLPQVTSNSATPGRSYDSVNTPGFTSFIHLRNLISEGMRSSCSSNVAHMPPNIAPYYR